MNDELARLENLREACALEAIEALIEAGEDPRAADSLGDRLRGVPLDATPLGDRIAELEDELALAQMQIGTMLRRKPSDATVAENDALRARLQVDIGGSDKIDELEQALLMVRAELRELREVAERNVADAQHLRQSAIALTAERDALRARVFEVEQRQVGYVLVSFASHEQWKAELAELGALRAQVEAARTYARQALDYGEDCDATDLLAAMDEAKNE